MIQFLVINADLAVLVQNASQQQILHDPRPFYSNMFKACFLWWLKFSHPWTWVFCGRIDLTDFKD